MHPKFTLKCGSGVAGEARVGSLCAVSKKNQKHPQEPFCLLPDQQRMRVLGKGSAWDTSKHFLLISVRCNLHMLSLAFRCLQSKT